MPKIELYNQDCLEAMKGMRDGECELAVVDPPYGLSIASNTEKKRDGDYLCL
jgi:DNA modification methylase